MAICHDGKVSFVEDRGYKLGGLERKDELRPEEAGCSYHICSDGTPNGHQNFLLVPGRRFGGDEIGHGDVEF